MASLIVLGVWLDDSGWRTAIEESKVISSGIADAMIGGKHVTRTRCAHQVTASFFSMLSNALHMKNTQRQIPVV